MHHWTRGRVLGRGSSPATVSLATTSQCSGEIFAVKSAELSQSNSLQREETILSKLNHPNIIRYIGCDTTIEQGRAMFNLLMEYASQGTIVGSIVSHRSRAVFDESLIRRYTHQIVKGLEYLHSRNIVHGDIKGSNILLSNEVKIADFGCAKMVGEALIGGTPMFMAPEVLMGSDQGFEADIWALGCTVIEMCTGKPPSWADEAGKLFRRIGLSGELPEFPSFLSDSGKDFLDKCLRIDPKERWSAGELLRHPFVDVFDSERVKESLSSSPTSVLDQGFWGSVEEGCEADDMNHVDLVSCSVKRIRDLVNECSRNESWDWEWEEVGWIVIRDLENDEFCSNSNSNSYSRKRDLKTTVCNSSKRHHRDDLAS